MVQQPFGGPSVAQTPPLVAGNNTLALPAIIATNNHHQQQVTSSAQYSPQANFYQQQIIKSAQQQQQYLQQQQPNRINGLPPQQQQQQQQQYSTSQQDSPSRLTQQQQQQLPVEGLYNGLARPGPIYAPKPSYYGQNVAANANQQQQPQQAQPMYQTGPQRPLQQQAAPYYQQQHSPASLAHPMQAGLSVRQLPVQVNGVLATAQQLSPNLNQTNVEQQQQLQQQQQQQQQQMQQLIMSYHQHQQLNSMQNNQHELMQPAAGQQQQAIQANHMQTIVPSQVGLQDQQLAQQRLDTRWSRQIEKQQRQQMQHHLSHSNLINENAARPSRFSDRDSVSTVNRFNQFDERRSFTMRSQYTNANQSGRYSNQFSFLKLTSEALKRILGLGSGASKPLLANSFEGVSTRQHNLQRNLNLSVTDANNTNTNSDKNVHPFNSNHTSAQAKITVLDSGEDYYFKRKVFKYQLVIMRLISLLGAAFVLLSPVAMLLIPKMESVFHPHEYIDLNSSPSTQSINNGDNQASTQLGVAKPIVTHAIGLAGASKQQIQNHHQQPYFTPSPQWRISECTSDCDGPLIGFVVRLIMLSIAYWAIFFRTQTVTLPRLDFYRCLLTSMAVLLTLAYWLFFIFRVFDKRYNDFELQYMTIVQFALSMLESLILLHYVAVVLLELRQRKKIYCLKVVRSPDGASKYYSCGSLSIQKCGQFVLEKYHRDFKSYNTYAEQLLELEDQLAQNIVASRGEQGDRSPNHTSRSRANSPANSTHRGDTLGGRASRRSASRTSRHHSRNGGGATHHRSPSESPVRSSHSRSQRKSLNTNERSNTATNTTGRNGGNQVKLYQVDLNPPERSSKIGSNNSNNDDDRQQQSLSDKNNSQLSNRSFQEQNPTEAKQHENDSNSVDQSSDATSRMKESSLETIRAANSTSDLLNQQPKTSAAASNSSATTRIDNNDEHSHNRQQQQQSSRDETESVRSVRSRRSTTRSYHRHRSDRDRERERDHHHHHGHRERSSSRVAEEAQDRHAHRSVNVQIPLADPVEDHERKLRRRKLRLLVAVQDTFEKIKKFDEGHRPNNLQPSSTTESSTSLNGLQAARQELGPNQAARSMYPSIARSLQKYLRLTKQTGRHNLQSIYEHLSKCVLYKLSPRAFLEKFLNQDPVWQQMETNLFASCRLEDSILMCPGQVRSSDLEINSWSLICDTLLSRQVDSGTFFVLKQGQVSLLVTVAKMPHLSLNEEVIDQKTCKFTLEPSPESSV